MQRALKIFVIVIMFTLVFVLVSIVHLSLIRMNDIKKQASYLNNLDKVYENYQAKGHTPFTNKEVGNLPLNEVRFLASHNSYKKTGSAIGRFFVGIGDSFSEANSLKYSYKPLTEQLMAGIYSLELDIRYRGNEFEVTHVPLVDNSSTSVKFDLALEEINTFLTYEPNSFPIIIILEIKDDYMVLDPKLKAITNRELSLLEETIINKLGDKVYQPKQLLKSYDSLKASVDSEGYPTIDELAGKVMFVIHAGKYANIYLEEDLNNQVLFTASYADELNVNSLFVIHNTIDVNAINNLVNNNYIVRTRVGGTTGYTNEDFKEAILSNAQILTSDFTVARSDLNKVLYLEDNKYTIIIKEG